MVFSSLLFLYIFLPLCVGCYYLVRKIEAKNAVLIAVSLFFYAWGEPVYVLLLVASAAMNYGIGLLMEHFQGNSWRKVFFVCGIILNLGLLVFFKYAGLLVETANTLFSVSIPVPQIRLPIGISFYTFQILSYVIDAYRGKVETQKSFSGFLLYVSLFPQLIAGPIVRYSDINTQLQDRSFAPDQVFYGVFRFCCGLGKKVLLANYCGKAASLLLDVNATAATTVGTWLGVLLFAFEIYFDFSGYSDMAIGLGRIFGFKFNYNENFNLPYIAHSVSDFWRRWHISLGTFFRDYVYIPLGGNRKRKILNLFIVWSLTGLWHGASWNFLLWGLYFFVLLVIEKSLRKLLDKIPKLIRIFATFTLVVFGWALFYFTDLDRLFGMVSVMLGQGTFCQQSVGITALNNLFLLLACVIGVSPLPRLLGLFLSSYCAKGEGNVPQQKQKAYALLVIIFELAVLFLCTVSLVGSAYNPFLYFRF